MQLLQSDKSRHCDCRERNDLGRIAPCITFRHSKVAMLCLESMPHGILEEAIGQIVHSSNIHEPPDPPKGQPEPRPRDVISRFGEQNFWVVARVEFLPSHELSSLACEGSGA